MHHIEARHGEDVKHHLSRSHFISDVDSVTSNIYGFDSVDDLYTVYSGLKRYCLQTKRAKTGCQSCPIFLLQPLDDPLHQVIPSIHYPFIT